MSEWTQRLKDMEFLTEYGYVITVEDAEELRKAMFASFPCYPICRWNGMDTTVELGHGDNYAPCEECYAWQEWAKRELTKPL